MSNAIQPANPIDLITDLAELAKRIRGHHENAGYEAGVMVKARDRAQAEMLLCGQALRRAKEIIGHGGFVEWVEANCEFSRQTAHKYMSIAQPNVNDALHLGHRSGFRLTINWLSKRIINFAQRIDPQVILAWPPHEQQRVRAELEPIVKLYEGLAEIGEGERNG